MTSNCPVITSEMGSPLSTLPPSGPGPFSHRHLSQSKHATPFLNGLFSYLFGPRGGQADDWLMGREGRERERERENEQARNLHRFTHKGFGLGTEFRTLPYLDLPAFSCQVRVYCSARKCQSRRGDVLRVY